MDKVNNIDTVNSIDTGLQSLLMMAAIHSINSDEYQLRHEFGHSGNMNTNTILLAAKHIGLKAKLVKQPVERLDRAPLPAIGIDNEGRYFIVGKYDQEQKRLLIQRPGEAVQILPLEEFQSIWTGQLILFTSKASMAGEMARFDFTWFIPIIIKYRKILGEILIVSFVLQIIGLVTPMFFQVVMDKVLVNNAMKTLHVIGIGLIMAILFEAVLSTIRTWLFAHTSSKIDVELGSRLFKQLVNLPLAYFQARRVGDSVARIRELENIRAFLTGNAMTVVLDILFSVVFFAVMFWYSPELTLVVALSIPLYLIISFIFVPIIRRRLDDKFNKGAENQSFLVESLSSIDTIKSMAVEPRWIDQWEKKLAAYVKSGLSVSNMSNLASSGINLISKLVTAVIMWMGANLVIEHKLTVGELVAFNMLAGQVSAPILRLAQMWNDFQQVGISMQRLGDILNTRTEIIGQKSRLPRIEGHVRFDKISFRYSPDAPEVLRDIDLNIQAGEVIGIVGRSGSGKSTLTRLVQRLFTPERGKVIIDGQDLAIIDTSSLRQQIGVVLQENVLFNRSIRDNISLSNPTYPIERVIQAAKLAGAHDFICELPQGYDTVVGEHGTGLSGGQRQRVAIARALISNPRVLIFDEATSALDYESEKIIQDNMRNICRGRTVLIIAHRLSAVRDSNRIIVMDRGQVVEQGTHYELLKNPSGIYSHLYALQQGAI